MGQSENIDILEVGLRDGLQILPQVIPTAAKLSLLNGLIQAGCRRIEVTSFVNSKRISQFEDAEKLISQLPNFPDVKFSALVLNEKGLERALDTGMKRIETSFSTTETHSRKNVRMSLNETHAAMKNVLKKARNSGIHVRGGLQCVWGCVYDGVPPAERIERMIEIMIGIGVNSISLADSTGMATPNAISTILDRILPKVGEIPVSLHFHNVREKGYENLCAALKLGIRNFDTSFGGFGGCPAIIGAQGNISTEKTVQVLRRMGFRTNIDGDAVSRVSRQLGGLINQTTML